MPTVHELLEANLVRVFGNRDAASRRAAIDETYAEDVVFVDPDDTVTGRDALAAKAAGLLDDAPADFVFAADGILYTDADTGALPWAFGPAGAPVVRGIDIITVRDGLIAELRTLVVPVG
jgi:hypothetical protein